MEEDEGKRRSWGEDGIPIYLPQWHPRNQVIPSVFYEFHALSSPRRWRSYSGAQGCSNSFLSLHKKGSTNAMKPIL